MILSFKPATRHHEQDVFSWLAAPHIKEFWDNDQAHRDDILNFMDGRKTQSPYYDGIHDYWICSYEGDPYALVMTHEAKLGERNLAPYFTPYLAKNGKTIGLDFCIGNLNHVGKGLAAPTLAAFMDFFVKHIDPEVVTFLIDPALNNPRAIHVYIKAGFEKVCEYVQGKGYFSGQSGILMARNR